MKNDPALPVKEKIISITCGLDKHIAVVETKKLAIAAGFDTVRKNQICLAVSELVTNIYRYGKRGTIHIRVIEKNKKRGIEIIARDEGPGIEDVEQAMQDGFSSIKSLGIGLPGIKRLMDEFEIDTAPGKGVKILVRKWG